MNPCVRERLFQEREQPVNDGPDTHVEPPAVRYMSYYICLNKLCLIPFVVRM